MVDTTPESRPQEVESVTAEQLTKELQMLKKQYNTMHNAVQSLSSQFMKLDRDVRAMAHNKKNIF